MINTEVVKGIWNKLPAKRRLQVVAAAVTFVVVYAYVAMSKAPASAVEAQAPITGIATSQTISLILQLATLGFLVLIYMQLKKVPMTADDKAKRKADLLKQLQDLEGNNNENTNNEITTETPPPPPPPPPPRRRKTVVRKP